MEFRRMRENLIETYRILRGLDKLDVERMFPPVGGQNLRVKGRPFKTERRRTFFSQRLVNLWNSLPQRAVEARSGSVFNTEIDRFLINKGIKGYAEKAGEC